MAQNLKIAVVIPCYNEAVAIAKVIADFQATLPEADIYVFDNNSTDETIGIASANGAIVRRVSQQGKGHVVRRIFADVDADIYVMADGDDTYDASSARKLVDCLVSGNHDMVVGVRVHGAAAAYRVGHVFGNRILTMFLSRLFGSPCRDILSGYRAFSRRFVKSCPVLTGGFEIETELTVHALELKLSVGEVETPYKERPGGSVSKLNTYRDGIRILLTMVTLFSAERPVSFYGGISIVLGLSSLALGIPIVIEYMESGEVPRFPTAILSTGLAIIATLSAVAGVMVHNVTRGRREMKMLSYLRLGRKVSTL